jgi:hypothetical protein
MSASSANRAKRSHNSQGLRSFARADRDPSAQESEFNVNPLSIHPHLSPFILGRRRVSLFRDSATRPPAMGCVIHFRRVTHTSVCQDERG